MRRYLSLVAGTVLLLSSGLPVQAQTHTVTLANENFSNGIEVEARVGDSSHVDQAKSLGTKHVAKGDPWSIECPQGVPNVIYRSHEGSNGWGEWIGASCGVTFTYRISDGGTVSRQSGGASGRCTPRTLRSSTGSFANANNAVKVSEAFLEITDNCEARLRFQAVTLLQNTKYVGNGGPVLFVNLMANGASLTETGGQMDVKIDACNTPEEKATTLRDSGLTPDRLNAATTFSLRMSGASGTRCP